SRGAGRAARARAGRGPRPDLVARARHRDPSAAHPHGQGQPMKTVRQLLYRDVFWSVFFVTIAFVALFFFIDFVDEMSRVGKNGYTPAAAALATLLAQPGHVYELFPIAVLIGTIYSMARLAQSSEFTILRTAGLGPGRALSLLGVIGLICAVLTFGLGEY